MARFTWRVVLEDPKCVFVYITRLFEVRVPSKLISDTNRN